MYPQHAGFLIVLNSFGQCRVTLVCNVSNSLSGMATWGPINGTNGQHDRLRQAKYMPLTVPMVSLLNEDLGEEKRFHWALDAYFHYIASLT